MLKENKHILTNQNRENQQLRTQWFKRFEKLNYTLGHFLIEIGQWQTRAKNFGTH